MHFTGIVYNFRLWRRHDQQRDKKHCDLQRRKQKEHEGEVEWREPEAVLERRSEDVAGDCGTCSKG